MFNLTQQQNLFEQTKTQKTVWNKKVKKFSAEVKKLETEIEEIKNNKIYENAFEWRFEFPEVLNDDGDFVGFDMVIGNPPYIQLQKMKQESTELSKMGFETFQRTGDIYSLFYEIGYKILKKKGFLIYITSNKWMRAGYGRSTRKFFAEKTNPIVLIDFGGVQIFDSATVDTNILMFSKEENKKKTMACVLRDKNIKDLNLYFKKNASEIGFKTDDSWVVLSEIEQRIKAKIEAVGTPLKDWDINIYRGILTGYNEAFIIDGKKRAELIAEDPKSVEIIRPILRGRDIKRYNYDFAGLWLINTHNGFVDSSGNQIERVDVEEYPAIKKHLDFHWKRIEKRYDQGDTPYNLRHCAYMEDFFKPKVIYPNMTKFLPFMYDEEGFLTNQKCFIITGENIEFLTGFFNSSLFKYCFRDDFPELQGGTRELSKIFFNKIAVLKVTKEINERFKSLIKIIHQLKKENQSSIEIELEIDNLLFELYMLSEDERNEIGFIEIQ